MLWVIIATAAYLAGYFGYEFYQFYEKSKLAPIYCVNCKYYEETGVCNHPDHLSLVTSKGKYSCDAMRNNSKFCGRFANLYKEKP